MDMLPLVTRGAGHMLSEKSQRTQYGTMFVDLDWPLNASRRLSASAELLVLHNMSVETTHRKLFWQVTDKFIAKLYGIYTNETSCWRVAVDFVSYVHALEDGSQNLSYDTGPLNLHKDVMLS